MKIFSVNKNLKRISYLLLMLFLAVSINLAAPSKCQSQPTVQAPSDVSSLVEEESPQEDVKTLSDIKKEFREQNKENLVSPVTVFSNLFALVLIMIALAWLYNKYGKSAISKALVSKNINKNFIKIVSTMPIGQNKFLHIVEVDDERMLIGATNTNISLIKSLKNDSSEEKVVSNE